MTQHNSPNVQTNKPATATERDAAKNGKQDGLQKTREATASREEIAQVKTPQGQSNRG